MNYEREGDVMLWKQGVVTFHARNVRRSERGTGQVALVTISEKGRILDEDDISLNKREERTRLANAAHKALNGAKETYPAEQLQHDLMLFNRDLWTAWMGESRAERTYGLATPTAPVFLLEDYLLQDAGTILFAPPGRGKSWTALLWAVCIDAGLNTIWNVLQVPVLFINLERSKSSMERRLGQVNEALGLPRERPMLMMHERGKSMADVFDSAQATIAGEGVGLVVIDSLSRAGTGSLVKDDAANRSMDFANALGCGWLALGHTPRAEEAHVFGSQMFDAAADLCVQMLTEESKATDEAHGASPRLGIGLQVTKANDTAKPPLRIWTYEFDREFGLSGVWRAERGEWPEVEGDDSRGDSPQDEIYRLLTRNGEMYVAQVAQGIGKDASNTSTYLKDMERRRRVVSRVDAGKTFYRVPSYREDPNEHFR